VGDQVGKGLCVISGVEPCRLHLERHALLPLHCGAYAITTRSYWISHVEILDPIARNRETLQSFREIDEPDLARCAGLTGGELAAFPANRSPLQVEDRQHEHPQKKQHRYWKNQIDPAKAADASSDQQ